MESKKAVLNDFPFVTTREEILHNKIAVCKIRNIRQVLIDKRTNVRYNYCIATLGKMLNRNSNKSVYGQFDFPFGWSLKYRRRKDARKIRSWLTRFYY